MVENCNYNRFHLKRRLIECQLLKEECSECSIGPIWNNKKLSLQLDHINGINNDNRIENLRFLCPNCHSQTDNFSGKSKNKGILLKNNEPNKSLIKKKEYEENQFNYIILVLNSNVDFTKRGWVNHISKVINQKPQKVNIWMKRFMHDFWLNNCNKRKIIKV